MNFFVRRPWDLPQKLHTTPDVFRDRKQHRRDFLKSMGIAGTGLMAAGIAGCSKPTPEELEQAGQVESLPESKDTIFPAARNELFEYGRPETKKYDAANYTNFYEFSVQKDSWRYVEPFEPTPWTLEVAGECVNPRKFDLDELYKEFQYEERAYRFRCVEAWAMCVPWTGFPLSKLLEKVSPKASAKYVSFQTFYRPEQARGIEAYPEFPWPYTEGLTIEEAKNELVLLATGVFGEPLPKQHGAPVRVIIPWKYGFKGAKSIVRIQLMGKKPVTFWNDYNPREYGFEANVDPAVPHPRWSQSRERMLGSGDSFETLPYNGYGDYVGSLYS
ncbi:MAG: protein-methionine-sulfoxide reductase catalytic subunit MsrP [Planctomycetaceae bacterium]|jgi:methionine sulfoxide reductase catalytic subunit|nr:protein-methionine-sulfoxide reductase catalytic subunit MsrP [bacterium]MDB4680195.1 protein-methionine-sulfoxide reductase catalytic subunit MsrP [Planctomycetaceae bacterium]MDG2387856.1 protein-methionine-sulfoxide reductase catalytic subunit MsrP [Planctomycetaceae bacterium]